MSELRTVNKQNELRISANEAKCNTLEEKVIHLKQSVIDLNIKLTQEAEALIRTKGNIKELSKDKAASQLAYETQKEQCELTKKENAILLKGLEEEKKRCEEMKIRYAKLYEENKEKCNKLQEAQRQLIDSEYRIKSLDTRLAKSNEELIDIKQKNKSLEELVSTLKPKEEYLSIEKAQLHQQVKLASEKLLLIIQAKNSVDVINNELKTNIEKHKALVKDKEEVVSRLKGDVENLRDEIESMRRELLLEESRKASFVKEAEIVKEELNNRINELEEKLQIEINSKTAVILQVSSEQKMHLETKTVLLKTSSELENIRMKLCNTETTLMKKSKVVKELIREKTNLKSEIGNIEAEKEVMRLDIEKNTALLKELEEFYKAKLNKKKEKINKLKTTNELHLAQQELIQEDLYSRCAYLYKALNETNTKVLFAS